MAIFIIPTRLGFRMALIWVQIPPELPQSSRGNLAIDRNCKGGDHAYGFDHLEM